MYPSATPRRSTLVLALLAATVALVIVVGASAAPPLPGAVFTTNSGCAGVNINIFASKDDVYLDGGPTHPGAAGLPDGEYYVKVTQPDGTLLGTSVGAADETPVSVTSGEFAQCYQLSSILVRASDSSAGYDDTGNPGGEYKVWVCNVSTFDNNSCKTDNFKVKSGGAELATAQLSVYKFYDANANGINDDGQYINGWKIRIQDSIDYIRYTPVHIILDPDDYTVTEFTPVEPNWVRTTPNPVSVNLQEGDDKTVEFGNLCLGAGGGRTLGFWSNRNGEATMKDGGTLAPELAFLSFLSLRNASGANFDPATYPSFRSWLLGANATNMAYMLSAQLAAMTLNVESGFVSGNALVYAPQLLSYAPVPGLSPLGFIKITDLTVAANSELLAHGLTLSGNASRGYQEALKNALDSANNNLNFAQARPCAFSFP